MALTSSMEDYLEAVLILHQKHGSVRGVDIAVHLGVTKPSVSRLSRNCPNPGILSKILMAHSPSQIQVCKSLHRFMRNICFSPSSLLKQECRRKLRKRMPASWNTLSARRALQD